MAARPPNAVDFWRGFALVTIFIDHVPGLSYARYTFGNVSIADAADLFVFLAGWSLRLMSQGRGQPRRLSQVTLRLFGRALELYAAQVLITLLAIADFAATLRAQIGWLKAHKVDVVLVGLQFAPEMLRDAHYVEIRDLLRKIAAEENVVVVRFSEAMQIIDQALATETLPVAEEFDQNAAGYDCLAQYVARAITLGAIGKGIPSPSKR